MKSKRQFLLKFSQKNFQVSSSYKPRWHPIHDLNCCTPTRFTPTINTCHPPPPTLPKYNDINYTPHRAKYFNHDRPPLPFTDDIDVTRNQELFHKSISSAPSGSQCSHVATQTTPGSTRDPNNTAATPTPPSISATRFRGGRQRFTHGTVASETS